MILKNVDPNNGKEVKGPGKILIPKPRIKANHDQRRHTRRVAAKMLEQADAYILVMWKRNGKTDVDPEPPVAVIDVQVLSDQQTIIPKVMGKMAQHTLACMRYCEEQLKMTEAERGQADLVAAVKQKRSQELADAAEYQPKDDQGEPDAGGK